MHAPLVVTNRTRPPLCAPFCHVPCCIITFVVPASRLMNHARSCIVLARVGVVACHASECILMTLTTSPVTISK
eukprot:292370-Rhodomonas_salina.1